MIRLLLILLLCLEAFGTVLTVNPTADTYADSTNKTYNYGSSVEYYIGNRTGTAETIYLSYFDLSSIPAGSAINSAVCSLWCTTIANADGWYVRVRPLDSAWVVGTGNGAYQHAGASWNNQGYGTSVRGTTITAVDSCWGDCGATTVPPKGGAWTAAAIDSEIINSTTDSTIALDLTAWVQAVANGTATNNGLHFFGTSTASSRRVVAHALESTTAARRPKLVVDYDAGGDSTFLRIRITPPSAPLTDYPILVNFLAYPDLASNSVTFYDADSTTKLYWWPDSVSGHYFRAWVVNDWAAASENIFVQQTYNPSYMNADSVFLIYENWNSPLSASEAVNDWDDYNCTVFDTSGPMLIGNPAGADSVIRESSGVIRDWQENTVARRYKFFYCGEKFAAGTGTDVRYTDNFLMWAYTSELGRTWTKADTLTYDSSGTVVPMRMEDPDIVWLPALSKWLMVCENHQTSNAYHVGMFTADSLDEAVWEFRGNISLLEASALGGPANWLNKEQASPALCWSPNQDTLYCAFEAFDGAGTSLSFTGMAASFVGALGIQQDTIGIDWHLLDSTGTVNDANPSPIIRYGETGAPDSATSIPDALLYVNGEYVLVNHVPEAVMYQGGSIPDLMRQVRDSAQLADCFIYDSTDGNFIGSSNFDISDNHDSVYLARARDFDSLRISTDDFYLRARAGKLGSYHRFRGGEAYTSNGQLIMYPSQWITGSLTLSSADSFAKGFVVEAWIAMTEGASDSTPLVSISFGSDTLADFLGTTTENAQWWETATNRGYTARIHPSATRWYKSTAGTDTTRLGSDYIIDANCDTIQHMHKWSFYYTTDDSLQIAVDDVIRVRVKDNTYAALYSFIHFSQCERQSFNLGGNLVMDSVRVRKFTNANGTATPSDTLRNNQDDTVIDNLWNRWTKWVGSWSKW